MASAVQIVVWFQFRDTCLTYESSYFGRLNYVHQNAVKHGLVKAAGQYAFCSVAWFENNASDAFARKVASYRCDSIHVEDDF